MLGITQRDT